MATIPTMQRRLLLTLTRRGDLLDVHVGAHMPEGDAPDVVLILGGAAETDFDVTLPIVTDP